MVVSPGSSAAEGRLEWLITPEALAMFHDANGGVLEPLHAGTNYRIDGLRTKIRRPGVFASKVRLFLRGPVAAVLGQSVIRETILVGPGKSLGGEWVPLLVIGVRRCSRGLHLHEGRRLSDEAMDALR